MLRRLSISVCGTTVWLLAIVAAIAAPPDGIDKQTARDFQVRVVDEAGQPVWGASVGLSMGFGDFTFVQPRWWYYINPDGKPEEMVSETGMVSDAHGVARFPDRRVIYDGLVARHAERKLVGIVKVGREFVGDEITLTMRPECRIHGKLACSQLAAAGNRFDRTSATVRQGGYLAAEFISTDPVFEFYLPAGTYELHARSYDSGTLRVGRKLVVAPDRRELDLGTIELPASPLKLLEGKPAPELAGVVAWKNSEPLALSKLRGKVVVLDFWGWWCGACVSSMPKLFDLHDQYAADGLVIIGIHVDGGEAIKTVESLDAKLAETRESLWNGRDIPYPIALVEDRETPFATGATLSPARSQVAADYGVSFYPTYLLIDRQGNVAGQFYPNAEGLERLRKLLGRP